MIVIRRYEPIPTSSYAWAHHPRLLIQLDETGHHAHAFYHQRLGWRISERDVARGRVSGAQRDALNRFLAAPIDPIS